jgi:hypothetical protein
VTFLEESPRTEVMLEVLFVTREAEIVCLLSSRARSVFVFLTGIAFFCREEEERIIFRVYKIKDNYKRQVMHCFVKALQKH